MGATFRRCHTDKVKYKNQHIAWARLRELERDTGIDRTLGVYKCQSCGCYHIGHCTGFKS